MDYRKKLHKIAGTILAFSFLFTACELGPGDKIDPVDAELSTAKSTDILDLSDLSRLPEGSEDRMNPKLLFESETARQSGQELMTDPYFQDMVQNALFAVGPTSCSDTELNAYLERELADWDFLAFYAGRTGMLNFPTYDALLFTNTSDNQYFGKKGEYTKAVTKAFRDLKRFWDIESSNIVLGGMHGSMLRDRAKLIQTGKILYGDDNLRAEYYADLILSLLNTVPQYRNGEHPVFTFNAFSSREFDFPSLGRIPAKIILGDGILEAYTALGLGDVAPQAILAHEFAHQIQFELDLFNSSITDPAEANRRMELMADAYAAYYLSHARGATMQWKRVQKFLSVFFNIGDCGFARYDHHGTPLQRMAAAEWGYKLADNAKKQGKILSSLEFADLFDAQLSLLVAP